MSTKTSAKSTQTINAYRERCRARLPETIARVAHGARVAEMALGCPDPEGAALYLRGMAADIRSALAAIR